MLRGVALFHSLRKTKVINSKAGLSVVLVEDGKLGDNDVPVTVTHSPFFYDVLGSEVEHFSQTVIIGENSFGFSDFLELAVQILNDIGRIYYLPNFNRICKKR